MKIKTITHQHRRDDDAFIIACKIAMILGGAVVLVVSVLLVALIAQDPAPGQLLNDALSGR